jgi:hypothetical protein
MSVQGKVSVLSLFLCMLAHVPRKLDGMGSMGM